MTKKDVRTLELKVTKPTGIIQHALDISALSCLDGYRRSHKDCPPKIVSRNHAITVLRKCLMHHEFFCLNTISNQFCITEFERKKTFPDINFTENNLHLKKKKMPVKIVACHVRELSSCIMKAPE